MSGVICVVGSSNTDMVVKSKTLPAPGETVMGGQFLMNPGGKGANQAVAAVRLGGRVALVAKVGNDVFGQQALEQFRREMIDVQHVTVDNELPSGVALINVNEKGENCITVAQGSNSRLLPADVEAGLQNLIAVDWVIIQLEIPLPTVGYAIRRSFEAGLRVILNPAPAAVLPDDLLACVYLITPNETEAERLTGVRVTDLLSAREAAQVLQAKGVPNVVITLGSRGAYLHTKTVSELIPAPVVTAIDTTAAGDCFNGALAVALAEGRSLKESVAFACQAAAICVTRMGAQASMPYRTEVG